MNIASGFSKIKTFSVDTFQTLKDNPIDYALKGVGLCAVGLGVYDAHHNGKEVANEYAKSCDAEALLDSYENTNSLDSPSIVRKGIKDAAFDFEADNKVRAFFNRIGGYFKGFGEMCVQNAAPIALGATTMLTKGLIQKASAIGLAAYGAYIVAQDFLGVGQKKHLS